MKNNLPRRGIFSLYRTSVIKKHQLQYLFWECTLRCNLSCAHCGSDCLKTAGIPDMPVEDFVRVLDEIHAEFTATGRNPQSLMICITGGEPLLRNDLEAVGAEISKRGFHWGIVTNALTLTRERLDSLLAAGMGSLSISLDGTEEQHNWLRQNSRSYAIARSAISYAVQKKIRAFDVITCVHGENMEELPLLRQLLVQLKVRHWRIFSVFPSGRAADGGGHTATVQSLTPEQYRNLMDFICKTRRDFPIHLNYSCEGYLGDYELAVRDFYFFCRAGITVASVMCDGSVTGCLSVRGKDFIQGSIYERPFMEIWNNEFHIMRDRSWTKRGKCAECKHWNQCRGNGLHLHATGESGPAHCNLSFFQAQAD